MNTLFKQVCLVLVVMVSGSTCLAQHHGDYRGNYRGDYHGNYRGDYRGYNHGYNGYSGHSYGGYHGYYDSGRHYGYYRNTRGDLVFGLLGLGVLAAVISASDRTTYVQQPIVYRESPQVVYVQQPIVVQPQVVYQQPVQVIQQPVVVQQPAQVEPPQPLTVTVSIQNSNGSFTPVILRQAGAQWVGPKGEYYDNVPTVGQLRPAYGF